jgi:serine O-acetyltransferase
MKNCDYKICGISAGDKSLDKIVLKICETYSDGKGINHIEGFNLPSETEVISILNELVEIIFPGYFARKSLSFNNIKYFVGETITRVYSQLTDQISRAMRYNCAKNNCKTCNVPKMSSDASIALLNLLPEIRESMKLDIEAAYDGDPAAKSLDEIALSYPGIKAITIHRIAHELFTKNVPLIPRMMSEYAHRLTGIDIHPGAKMGKRFFIDHGTGVVIGETTIIGNDVTIYQGVTLGALSFPKDASGKIIRDKKRHPTLEENVTIYSGATLLGDITIGKNSVIGGNVWLTESVPQGTKITAIPPELKFRKKTGILTNR